MLRFYLQVFQLLLWLPSQVYSKYFVFWMILYDAVDAARTKKKNNKTATFFSIMSRFHASGTLLNSACAGPAHWLCVLVVCSLVYIPVNLETHNSSSIIYVFLCIVIGKLLDLTATYDTVWPLKWSNPSLVLWECWGTVSRHVENPGIGVCNVEKHLTEAFKHLIHIYFYILSIVRVQVHKKAWTFNCPKWLLYFKLYLLDLGSLMWRPRAPGSPQGPHS